MHACQRKVVDAARFVAHHWQLVPVIVWWLLLEQLLLLLQLLVTTVLISVLPLLCAMQVASEGAGAAVLAVGVGVGAADVAGTLWRC